MKLHKIFQLSIVLVSFYTSYLAASDQYPSIREAAFYNNHSQQQWEVAFEALKKIEFQGSEAVLDIGCGSGKVTANIAGRLKRGSVLGLDLSEGMIAFAQETYQPFYTNLSFIRDDIQTYNSSSKFDCIFSSSALHWILGHQSLIAKVYDLLNEQGHILFTIPCTPLPEVALIFRDVTTQEPWQTYLKSYNHPRRKFTSDEYVGLLEEAGFVDVVVDQIPYTYRFETKRELANWYAAFSPMLGCIPSDMHEIFLKDIVDRYLKSFPLDDEGRAIFKQYELIIKAKK